MKWRLLYDGPYLIEERIGPVNYLVRRLPNGRKTVVHVDRMRLWRKSAKERNCRDGADSEADDVMEFDEPLCRSERLRISVDDRQ